jgi:hypothetical protein
MIKVSDFRNREVAFFDYKRIEPPKRGYQISNSENLRTLLKLIDINEKKYNSYVTIAKYSSIPRFPLNPKVHWQEFREWVKIRDETITNIDFMLDFDAEPTIQGLKKAWADVQTAIKMLNIVLGEQTKYLTIWFSGNKGFHILGKTKVETTAQENIDKQLEIAVQLSPLCPTLDTSIYDTARLRKLLGSRVYSDTFGKTRVIPVCNNTEFEELISVLNTEKQQKYFKDKTLININNINIMGEKNEF